MGLATRREAVHVTCKNLRDVQNGSATNGIVRKLVVLLQEQIDELRVEVKHLKMTKALKKKGRGKEQEA